MNDRAYVLRRTIEPQVSMAEQNGMNEVWMTTGFVREIVEVLHENESLIHFLNHQREKGHWIFGDTNGHGWMKCSQCNVSQDKQTACYSFCPNCGANMTEDL